MAISKKTNQKRAINWLWVIITMLVFALLIKLGFWQSARAIEKEQRLARIEMLQKNDVMSLDVLLEKYDKNDHVSLNDLPVFVKGEFDSKTVFLLDNQPNNGQFGYRIIQLAQANDFSFLVNLGWLKGSINRDELPIIEPLSGDVSFKGNIRFVEIGIQLTQQQLDEKNWPLRIQQIEIDKLSTLLDKPLLPFVIYVDKQEKIGFTKNWQPVVMPPEKHWGYAFQWFSLALAWLSLMIWAAVKSKNVEGQSC